MEVFPVPPFPASAIENGIGSNFLSKLFVNVDGFEKSLKYIIIPVERISQAPFISVAFETVEPFEKIQTPCN